MEGMAKPLSTLVVDYEAGVLDEAAARRGRALAAARSMFAMHGYDGLQMDRIAHQVGASRSWIYGEFPDRRSLLTAVVHEDVGELTSRISASLDWSSNLDLLLEKGFSVFLDFVEERRQEYVMLFGQAGRLEPRIATILIDLRRSLAGGYVAAFRPAVAAAGIPWPSDAEARLVAQAMIALVEGSVQAWLTDSRMPRQRLLAMVVPMVRRALSGRVPVIEVARAS
jgi:AcrR family transcriptional regulator